MKVCCFCEEVACGRFFRAEGRGPEMIQPQTSSCPCPAPDPGPLSHLAVPEARPFIINWYNVPLSSVSHSSKSVEPGEGDAGPRVYSQWVDWNLSCVSGARPVGLSP